jgi:hypothetical protein
VSQGIALNSRTDTPRTVAKVLRHQGCVLLRDALPRQPLLFAGEAVHDNAQQLTRLIGREVNNDLPLCFSDRHSADPTFVGFNGRSLTSFTDPLAVSGFDRSWFYGGERNYRRWFWENGASFPNLVLGLVLRSALPRVYRFLYGEPTVCFYAHCAVRYQRADIREQSYFFHQDGSYQSRDIRSHTGLTTWIPLVDCGVDAPGLELYPHALDEVLPVPSGTKGPYLFCDEKTVLERFGDRLWAPSMRVGDVLIFDHTVVHRTHITTDMRRERQSADFRIFPASGIPDYVRQDSGWFFELP